MTEQPGGARRVTNNGNDRLRRWARVFLAGIAAGFISGMIAGAGSRIAMRIVALVAGKEFYGRLTEAEEVVGEISTGGTLFLVFFTAFISIPFGLTYAMLRPAFPGRPGWRKGILYGLLLYAIFGSTVVDSDNFDFRVFVSPILAVALFVMLFPLFGIAAGCMTQWIAPERDGEVRKSISIAIWTPLIVAAAIGLSKNAAALLVIFR